MTANQLELPLAPLVIPDPAPTIEARWEAFHAANPHVAAHLARLARERMARGRRRLSIKMLWELLRDDYIETTGEDGRRLNNDLTAPYAKHLMATYADLQGVFETRTSARALLAERPGAWA